MTKGKRGGDEIAESAEVTEERRRWESQVAYNILQRLGSPPQFEDIQIRHINNHTYRVNVRIKRMSKDSAVVPEILIVRSFLVQLNDSGDILRSDPRIEPITSG
jgi:hypothetical protein